MQGTMGATGARPQRHRLVWKVGSQSHAGGAYFVRRDADGWHCSCPAWAYRGAKRGEACKHIRRVQTAMATEVG